MRFGYIQQFFFFGLLLITSVTFLWMIGGFIMPIFWAIVLAIVFYPFFTRCAKVLFNSRGVASIITILLLILIVLIPLISIAGLVVKESITLYQSITENSSAQTQTLSLLERINDLSYYLEPYGISEEVVKEKLKSYVASISAWLTSSALTVSQVTFSLVINVCLMLYILFYLLKDGEAIQTKLLHILPLGDKYEKLLFERFSATTRAVVKGTLIIAIIQGVIGGVLFYLTGVTAPVLWGVVMTFLAIIPAVGPAIIWIPAGIILILSGFLWEGFTILLVGSLLISLVDNVLRPLLVGRDTQMPDAIVLLSTIGGLATFGISGFVVGPIIAAFFISLWSIFEEKYHAELSQNV